jgi:hypothetical protein
VIARISVLLAFLGTLILIGSGASQAGEDCSSGGDLNSTSVKCVKSGSETNAYVAAHSDHTFSVTLACATDNALCSDTPTCRSDGQDGQVYNVFEDGALLGWQACLTDQEAKRLGGLTPAVVEHAFQRLSWPASPIVVQPPKGRTLVNFDTNFYTTNTHPTTQTVTLIGQQVTIEATPTEYTWHFGSDSSDSSDGDLTTTDSGAAYPDLRVTYRYTRVGDVQPSVDTTYSGRYRVGAGAWQTIPSTLTVPGQAVDLQVVSATPHLVGY